MCYTADPYSGLCCASTQCHGPIFTLTFEETVDARPALNLSTLFVLMEVLPSASADFGASHLAGLVCICQGLAANVCLRGIYSCVRAGGQMVQFCTDGHSGTRDV